MSSGPKKYTNNVYKRSPFDDFTQKRTDKCLRKGLTLLLRNQSVKKIPDDPAVFTPLASHRMKTAKDGLRRYKHLLAQTLILPVVAWEQVAQEERDTDPQAH